MPSIDTRRLVPGLPEVVSVKRVSSRQYDTLGALLGMGQGTKARALGVSLRLSKKGSVEAIALATQALVVQLTVESNTAQSNDGSRSLSGVLNHSQHALVGVDMARILLLLHRQLNIRARGVDLPIMFGRISEKGLPSPGEIACETLGSGSRKYAINALWYRHSNDELCLRAWLSACMVTPDLHDITKFARVSTHGLRLAHLACLSLHVMNVELLQAMKPTHMDNDFEGWEMDKDGKLVIHNARFKTKVRHSKRTFVKINGDEAKAYTDGAKGKKTTLTLKGKLRADIQTVRVIGREEATSAESARDSFIVQLLQADSAALDRSPFVRLLWFPRRTVPQGVQAPQHDFEKLNPSQNRVANAMISGGNLIDRVQGPPGSGKTSTIAAGLCHFQACRQTVWVVAQSNVGVKNIARSIIKREIDFKLLVSNEFYAEWHEHLYPEVRCKLIRSDEFGKSFDVNRRIGDTHIILCTLSMLSNPMLDMYGVFKYRPMEILLVDEASQIDTLEFMHLFNKFNKLRKVCMFGDPQQLPPYGKEQAPKMKTIFDFPHLKSASFFLDIQYRMPIELGRFISDAMYESKLNSHSDNVKGTACIRAINVRKGKEELDGSSWKNMEEGHTVVNLVRHYYQKLTDDFCIITPYDAQRALITKLLKAANLPFDIVYNVDSFQGHEAPYVIVSAVRTTKPGFLSFNNRMNVMLSRCQRGMVLVTQRAFVEGGGKGTLLGRLVQRWEAVADVDAVWVDAMEVADRTANLPGAPGRLASRPRAQVAR